MAKMNKRLAENLVSQVEMHEALLDILEQESRLSASCKLHELEEIQSVRDICVKRISELESNRIQIVEDYRRENGINESIALTDILANCEDDLRTVMTDARTQLKDLIHKIRRTGKQNAETALARIACFDEVQKAVHKRFYRHAVYSFDGLISKPKGSCLLQKSV